MSLEFEDNSMACKKKLEEKAIKWLYESAGELQAQVQRNTRVDSGQTKGSWQYKVDEGAQKAYVGSNLENAIWEEFGTGEYALHGDGRKTPWKYQDRHGNWHTTKGKRPRRALFKAYKSKEAGIRKAYERILAEMNS